MANLKKIYHNWTAYNIPVTSVNNSTGDVTVNAVPWTWTTGYVLTKTANWYDWAAATWWVTSVNWQTWAVTVNEVPWTWTTDYVLTKTSSWYWWAAPSWWIENDTTWTTSTVTGIWAGTETEYWDLWTHNWTVLYFTF